MSFATMFTSSKDLCSVPRLWLVMIFAFLVASMTLNLIVAVGNWNLYSRVEKLESIVGSQATPQSQQIP
jgi:hypothetical protein